MMNKYFVGENHFVFDNILVMQFAPRNLKANIKSRVTSSFLYVEKGGYRYTVRGEVFDVRAGEAAYIPRGAAYTYAVVERDTQCIQVEFDLGRLTDGRVENACFSDRPVPLGGGEQITALFYDLVDRYFKDHFMTLSVLYRMLSLFFGSVDSTGIYGGEKRKIGPALEYINGHVSDPISVPALAAMCGISTSHFRRLFKSFTGRSPVRYKNWVVMKRACSMLSSGAMNVGEIADVLGFPDIYTFSQAFKKEIGVSPKQYIPKRADKPSNKA